MRPLIAVLGLVLLWLPCADAGATRRLPVERVSIATHGGQHDFKMEIATDDKSRADGLMHRAHLAKDAGMLFDFGKPVMTAFWMKDTPLSLDIIFVRADGTISTVAANAVPFSTVEIVSAEPIRAVIEINGGLARTLGILPGDQVKAAIFANSLRH